MAATILYILFGSLYRIFKTKDQCQNPFIWIAFSIQFIRFTLLPLRHCLFYSSTSIACNEEGNQLLRQLTRERTHHMAAHAVNFIFLVSV